jgi:hypothetical protein
MTRTDSASLRAIAKAERDRAIVAADAARPPLASTRDYLAWNEARHQAWQTYARAVLDIADGKA